MSKQSTVFWVVKGELYVVQLRPEEVYCAFVITLLYGVAQFANMGMICLGLIRLRIGTDLATNNSRELSG